MTILAYEKLVRDKIPEIIKANGQKGFFRILEDEEYQIKLNEKMKEELIEYLTSNSEREAVQELADMSEIIDAILELKGVSKEKFCAFKQKRKEDRGGFQKRLLLEKVEK